MISQVLAIAATLSVLALKEEYIPASLNLNWGLSARQGMRPSMEDTHVARMNFNRPGDAFFGLYDGHGGSEAAFTAAYGKVSLNHFMNIYNSLITIILKKYIIGHTKLWKRYYS